MRAKPAGISISYFEDPLTITQNLLLTLLILKLTLLTLDILTLGLGLVGLTLTLTLTLTWEYSTFGIADPRTSGPVPPQ